MDPDFRLCLAQQWLIDNRQALEADGFDRDEVADAFVDDEPDHQLWHHFERVHLREWTKVIPSPDVWGIGANTRLVGPDAEVLYVHDTSDMEDGQWQPGEQRWVFPVMLRWDGRRWRVLNFGSESVPQPGWPPVLSWSCAACGRAPTGRGGGRPAGPRPKHGRRPRAVSWSGSAAR